MLPGGANRLTQGLAVVTVVAWIAALVSGHSMAVAEQAGFVPARVSGDYTGFFIPYWLTPLTATLVHGGAMHLGFNMLMLVYCGRDVETVLGWRPLMFLYVLGAYAAAAGQYLVDPASPVPMVGASGAISAILAVYALLFGRNEVRRLGPVPAHWVRAIWLALGWIAVQWLVGVASQGSGYGVATAAHVGGFLVGLALARPLLAWRYRSA